MSYQYRHSYRKKESDFKSLKLNFTIDGKKLIGTSKNKKENFRGFAYFSDSLDAARLAILTEYRDMRLSKKRPEVYRY